VSDLLDLLGSSAYWVAVLRIATPLILGTLGVLWCERAGVLNLGIEGIMVAGAFTGWLAVYQGLPLWAGVAVAALTGATLGLLHALLGIPDPQGLQSHPKLGASWEGFCLEQILDVCGARDAYFWGTHSGAELDLLLRHAGRRLGIEFKFSERPSTTKSMRIALEDLALDHLYVVYPGEHEFPLDESITAITLPRLIDALE